MTLLDNRTILLFDAVNPLNTEPRIRSTAHAIHNLHNDPEMRDKELKNLYLISDTIDRLTKNLPNKFYHWVSAVHHSAPEGITTVSFERRRFNNAIEPLYQWMFRVETDITPSLKEAITKKSTAFSSNVTPVGEITDPKEIDIEYGEEEIDSMLIALEESSPNYGKLEYTYELSESDLSQGVVFKVTMRVALDVAVVARLVSKHYSVSQFQNEFIDE